jgi:hypothetical protein
MTTEGLKTTILLGMLIVEKSIALPKSATRATPPRHEIPRLVTPHPCLDRTSHETIIRDSSDPGVNISHAFRHAQRTPPYYLFYFMTSSEKDKVH